MNIFRGYIFSIIFVASLIFIGEATKMIYSISFSAFSSTYAMRVSVSALLIPFSKGFVCNEKHYYKFNDGLFTFV